MADSHTLNEMADILIKHVANLDRKTVHLDGTETVTGDKAFTGGVTVGGYEPECVVAKGNGYIRYASGFQMCWGSNVIYTASGSRTFTFAKPFISSPLPICCYGDDANYQGQYLALDVYDRVALVVSLSPGVYPVRINWLAIGYWK